VCGLLATAACTQPPPSTPQTQRTDTAAGQSAAERGKYLVTVGVCHDCHTPKTFGPTGPQNDLSRALSGHPANEKVAPVPMSALGPDKWGALGNNHFTAWAGPWGVSYARNLTPDMTTGLGSWTEEMFIKTIREGKHQGEGRPLLPPMPWPEYKLMTDDDLKAVWAYLRTLPPINNAVPDPTPPEAMPR
jgi:mono/diheme cytochrome c family protein